MAQKKKNSKKDLKVKYISSQKTEDLETKERVIRLGKTIVQELGLEPGVDTLSRWLAHYIAELINKIEVAPPKKKSEYEKECLETILRVWERRPYFPNGSRPFEEFEPIFRTLQYLSRDTGTTLRYQIPDFINQEELEDQKDVQKWLRQTIETSKFTKRLQRFCLAEAYRSAENEKTKEWLNHVEDPELFDDTMALFELKWYSKEFHEMSEEEQQKELQKKGLESFLTDIEEQVTVLGSIKKLIQERLKRSE
ncbi:MAG: hypothetical protein WD511_00700 [Balneolaceae bacterium]